MSDRYGELTMPLLLYTSRQDHVVEPAQSEYLAQTYGGAGRPSLARPQLPRRDPGLRPGVDLAGTVEFIRRVTGSCTVIAEHPQPVQRHLDSARSR